jgi:hypothetical protein
MSLPSHEQPRKMKCPHCGWIRTVLATILEDESAASVVAGPIDSIRDIYSRIRQALSSPSTEQAGTWIDIPKCSNCQNVYQYNPYTGETRP